MDCQHTNAHKYFFSFKWCVKPQTMLYHNIKILTHFLELNITLYNLYNKLILYKVLSKFTYRFYKTAED